MLQVARWAVAHGVLEAELWMGTRWPQGTRHRDGPSTRDRSHHATWGRARLLTQFSKARQPPLILTLKHTLTRML